MNALVVALVALSLGSAPASPQAESGSRNLSIYDVSLAVDLPVLAAASLAGAIPYAFAPRLIQPRCPCSPDEVNRFDRRVIGNHSDLAAAFSDIGVVLAIAGPAALDYAALGRSRAHFEDAVVLGESVLVNAGAVSIVKVIAQRPIPRVYSGDAAANVARNYRSFYSGHTSTAFAALATAAYTLDARYGAGIWPWLAMTAFGSAIGAARILGGYHFYSDVIVGAAAGTGIGVLVPALHRRRSPERDAVSWSVAPMRDGLLLQARF